MAAPEQALAGRRIAVPESRALDVFATLLERRGATVLRCPLVEIRDAADPAPVLDWLRRFNDGACDDLVLFTGEGLSRLLDALDRHAPEWGERFIARLARVRIIARGPKPGRVLRELGLRPSLVAEPATTPGVIACLRELDLRGRKVGVQLYGTEPNAPLMAFLAEAGAHVLPVAPYRYADAADDADVLAMLEGMRQGEIDAIAFTSIQQVERLFRLAGADVSKEALSRVVVAAVGPVVADTLAQHGVRVHAVPADSYYMKPLSTALAEALARP
ncbi:uroporphyrinogen-III synthase [Dyella sp. SG562]|uniref:uroporphyrinogen-III synthase n=1 Tax=unclassified Dyella TaxID=2634549 RepID=UPI001423A536|nr:MULTISPECIES: uroporphyrinogen-III synthase [unclassified Dyella]NII73999.1 uroporphyrinogen-III synthase [Dyella sp. SG562]NKJ22334.1 uroporphyrinogen-III synthase [Dyella sp. SG609]